MNLREQTAALVYVYVFLLAAGCAKDTELPRRQPAQSDSPKLASQCVVREGRVVSINGLNINYPESEKLNWISPASSNSVDPELVAVGFAQESAAIRTKHAARLTRYAVIDEYLLLCGGFDPPFPDGSFCWVVNTKDRKYVGHFLDINSR